MAHVFSKNVKKDFRFTDFPFYHHMRRHIPENCNLRRGELAYEREMSSNRNKAKWRSSMHYISVGARHDLQSSRLLSGAQSRQTFFAKIFPHTHTHTRARAHARTHAHHIHI